MTMKQNFLMRFSKMSSLKCTIPKFAESTLEIEDFSSVESILLQKMVFKFRESPNCQNEKSEEEA